MQQNLEQNPLQTEQQRFFRALFTTGQRLETSTVLILTKKTNILFCSCHVKMITKRKRSKVGGRVRGIMCVQEFAQVCECGYLGLDSKL